MVSHENWMSNHNIRSHKEKSLNTTCFERTVYYSLCSYHGQVLRQAPNFEAPDTPDLTLCDWTHSKAANGWKSKAGWRSREHNWMHLNPKNVSSCKINHKTWMNCYDAMICTKEVTLTRLLDSCQGLSIKQSNRSKLSAETRRTTLPCLLISCVGL